MDLRETLEDVLQALRRKTPGVLGSVIADEQGLTVAGDAPRRESLEVLSAMATLIARSADTVFENLTMPGPPIILLEGATSGVAVLRLRASEMNLLCFFNKTASVGLVKLEMNRIAARVAEMLELGGENPQNLDELFVITTGGLLLRHYSSTLRTDLDRDILSGMLVAVQNFVKQTMATKEGALDELRYGNYTIVFIRGSRTVAAAVFRGRGSDHLKYPVMDALEAFESRFAKELATWNGDTSAFPGIDEYFAKVLRP